MVFLDRSTPSELIRATARVILRDKVESFQIGLKDTSNESLETAIDYLEGQIGLVLSIGTETTILYRSMINSWEVLGS